MTIKAATSAPRHLRSNPLFTMRDGLLGHPYPTQSQWTQREQEIDQKVAKMDLTPTIKAALADIGHFELSSVDVWQGSHFLFDGDDGALYDKWRHLPGVEARVSSHYPEVPVRQFQIRFGDSDLLFGIDDQGDTWFQMERYAAASDLKKAITDPVPSAGHILTFIEYLASGKNIGPLGVSPHTEHHAPLRIDSRTDRLENPSH